MESLGDDQNEQQGAAAELDYAATATSPGDGTGAQAVRSSLPAARREEVQRLLSSVLVVRCEASMQYAAPVVIMSQEESNIYAVIERHLKRDYILGAEKFWRLVRSELGVDYWRPRVYGAQLKVLQGARLPEYEEEFQAIQQVINSLQDCIRPESSPEALMQDLRTTVAAIQQWWGERNKKPDGGYKRPGPSPGPYPQQASKRRAMGYPPLLDQGLLQLGDGTDQDLLHDPAATAAALNAAAAAAATSGFMDLGAGDVAGGLSQLPFLNGFPQSAAAAPGSAAAADLGGGAAAGGLDSSYLDAAAAVGGNPLAPFLANPSGLLVLNVGGTVYRTTLNTLLSVQNSLFWQVTYGQAPAALMQRLASGEVFIDRNGEHFKYILEYLRACASGDVTFPLPNDARELQAVAREAYFYQLTELVGHVQHTCVVKHPSSNVFYDMAYLETGFRDIRAMREVERAKVVLMQQLNRIVATKQQEGFAVDELLPGTAHQQDEEGHVQHNMYFSVVFKKVVPLLPTEMMVPESDEEEEEVEGELQQQQQGAQHYQQQQVQGAEQQHQQQRLQYDAGSVGGAAAAAAAVS